MRRAGVLVALTTAAMVITAAGSARASEQVVQHYSFHGTVAEAVWDTSTPDTSTSTDITVARNQQGQGLFVYQFTATFDQSGTLVGAAYTTADVTSGFALRINASLSNASASGQNLPATTCSYDADLNPVGCTPSTLDLEATWTGQGPITRDESTAHFHSDGFTSTYHERGASRDATAIGVLNGLSLTSGDLEEAHLAKNTYGSVEVCIGSNC
jgi:hypothetical protein